MPTTKEGLQRLLEFFLFGMLRAADTLGNAPVFLREVEEEGLRNLMFVNLPTFQASDSVTETCASYTKSVDAAGMFDASDTVIKGDADSAQIEIGDRCPYRRVCTMRHDVGLPVHCIRGYALAQMLRIRLDAEFDWKLDRFGRPCRIKIGRARWR